MQNDGTREWDIKEAGLYFVTYSRDLAPRGAINLRSDSSQAVSQREGEQIFQVDGL